MRLSALGTYMWLQRLHHPSAPGICNSASKFNHTKCSSLHANISRKPSRSRSNLALCAHSGQAHMHSMAMRRTVRGVIFDMDGTVTVPVIDFAEMRRRCGVPPGGDILDIINSWPQPERQAAHAVIADIEEQALTDMKVMPGAHELCKLLDEANVPRGLITRNVMRSVHHFHQKHMLSVRPFTPSISRECSFPYKPSPDAFLHICTTWGIQPHEAIMVGDSVKDDVVCGNRAGALTILLDYQGKSGYKVEQFEGEQRPHFVVHSLSQISELLLTEFHLAPPPNPQPAVEAVA